MKNALVLMAVVLGASVSQANEPVIAPATAPATAPAAAPAAAPMTAPAASAKMGKKHVGHGRMHKKSNKM